MTDTSSNSETASPISSRRPRAHGDGLRRGEPHGTTHAGPDDDGTLAASSAVRRVTRADVVDESLAIEDGDDAAVDAGLLHDGGGDGIGRAHDGAGRNAVA